MPALRIEALNLRIRDIVSVDGVAWLTVEGITRSNLYSDPFVLWTNDGPRSVNPNRNVMVKI